ncbi:MAG: hypothetical protein HN576_13525 [Bacteriovoracaceae bacterium]|nr:hypothetical protein [Bacteriovoracaceae bacterium]
MSKFNGKKVLIAMTGRRDSTVAAYLLKKQGYECLGITFLMSPEDLLTKQIDHLHKNVDSKSENDTSLEEIKKNMLISKEKLYSRCHVSEINKVSEICNKLDITFYGVKAEDRFSAEVIDRLVGNKLGGKTFSTCVYCNNVKLTLLHEKAIELGCDHIATGHYAKVVANLKSGRSFIHAANDFKHDQSYLLSRVPQQILKKLILPLSETRLEEVEKVMNMIDFELLPSSQPNNLCYIGDARLPSLIEVCSSSHLLRTGHIFLQRDNIMNSEHRGIHNYDVGKTGFKLGNDIKLETKLVISELVSAAGSVVVSPVNDLYFDRIKLQNTSLDPNMDISKPFCGFIKLSMNSELLPCDVYFKNFNSAIIQFNQKINGTIATGTTVVVYNKNGISGRIVMSGEVGIYGVIHKNKLVNYVRPVEDPEEEAEEESDEVTTTLLPKDFH